MPFGMSAHTDNIIVTILFRWNATRSLLNALKASILCVDKGESKKRVAKALSALRHEIREMLDELGEGLNALERVQNALINSMEGARNQIDAAKGTPKSRSIGRRNRTHATSPKGKPTHETVNAEANFRKFLKSLDTLGSCLFAVVVRAENHR